MLSDLQPTILRLTKYWFSQVPKLEQPPAPALVRRTIISGPGIRTGEVLVSINPARDRPPPPVIAVPIFQTDNLHVHKVMRGSKGGTRGQRHRRGARGGHGPRQCKGHHEIRRSDQGSALRTIGSDLTATTRAKLARLLATVDWPSQLRSLATPKAALVDFSSD